MKISKTFHKNNKRINFEPNGEIVPKSRTPFRLIKLISDRIYESKGFVSITPKLDHQTPNHHTQLRFTTPNELTAPKLPHQRFTTLKITALE